MKTIIKIRKSWRFNPSSQPHSTPKGLRGYDRSESRRIERELNNLSDVTFESASAIEEKVDRELDKAMAFQEFERE